MAFSSLLQLLKMFALLNDFDIGYIIFGIWRASDLGNVFMRDISLIIMQ